MTDLTKKDKALIELTVRRIDFKLDGRVPWRKRRQIRDELRSNLTESAQDKGGEAAVQQLGNLNDIAKSYLELYRGRFDLRTGAYWAIATYAAIQIVGIAVILAFRAGIVAAGAPDEVFSFSLANGFGPYGGEVSSTGSTFVMTVASPAHVLLMLVAFVIGSSYRTVFSRR